MFKIESHIAPTMSPRDGITGRPRTTLMVNFLKTIKEMEVGDSFYVDPYDNFNQVTLLRHLASRFNYYSKRPDEGLDGIQVSLSMRVPEDVERGRRGVRVFRIA